MSVIAPQPSYPLLYRCTQSLTPTLALTQRCVPVIAQVRGLGETLVGNYAGRALSAVVQKRDLAQPEVLSFPSKSVGLFVDETLIFRSDSNGEDLDGACVCLSSPPYPTSVVSNTDGTRERGCLEFYSPTRYAQPPTRV